jgi:hypothetical protein
MSGGKIGGKVGVGISMVILVFRGWGDGGWDYKVEKLIRISVWGRRFGM